MHRKGFALAATLAALLALPLASAHAAISSIADAPTWTVGQPPVEAFAPDGDRVWVGGNFTTVAARTGPGVELELNGNPVAGSAELTDSTGNLMVDAVTSDGGGGWYVAGTFTRAAGVARPGLVHIAASGSADTTFNAQAAAGTVQALTLSGGVLYAGGTFTSIGGQTRVSLAALDPVTGSATGWDPPASAGGVVTSISIQGGFAWIGGGFTSIGATAVTNAAKVPLGTVAVSADATWLPNPNLQVRAILATATNVYMGGLFATVKGVTSVATNHVTKTNLTDGTPDAAWTPNANSTVQSLASDGTSLYAAGSFTSFGGATRRGVSAVRLDNTGNGAATTWYPGDLNLGGTPAAIAVAGGDVWIAGGFQKQVGDPRSGLAAAAADATGALLPWAPETTGPGRAIAADGSHVYAGGRFGGVGAAKQQTLMAVDLLTGQPMPYFNHTFDGDVRTIAVCNGVVYVGGTFFTVDSQNRLNVAAFDRNTGALTAWDPQADNDVDALTCGNGVIYMGGIFQILDFNNVPPRVQVNRGGLAAVDPVVGEPTAWDPGLGGGLTQVNALAVQGSTVYAGGVFAKLGNPAVTRNNLAAVDVAGAGPATSWDPNVTGAIQSLALSGSTIYAAGTLTAVGGAGRTRTAEISLATGAPTAFDPAPDNLVRSLALAPDGTVYLAGDFANVGGQPRTGIAAVDASGTATSWNPHAAGLGNAVAVGADGRVYAGGSFDGVTERATYGLATFSEPTSFATQPSLTSAPVAGQSENCDGGSPAGSLPAPQTIQWQLDGSAIPGATGSAYTPSGADVGHALSCSVSMRNLISSAQASSASMTVAAAPVVQAQAPPPFDIDGQPTPPPPVAGKSVIAKPTSGTVSVLLPGFKQFIPLPDAERIPVGTVIDARHGVVKLTTVGKNGKLQSAIFYEGEFRVLQGKGRSPMVELRLYGGNFSVCGKAKRAAGALAAAKIRKSRSIRHLWGNGSGLFRTKGRYASATIRGTKWLTDDRCDGTLVRVAKGAVTVRDIPKKKSLALKAPKSYLALARR